MTTTESVLLIKKGIALSKKMYTAIQDVSDAMTNPDFKLMLITFKDRLTAYEDTLHHLLKQFNDTAQEDSKVTDMMTKILTQTRLLVEKTDAHIATLLFDTTNDLLKDLYKLLNTHTAVDAPSLESVSALEEILVTLRYQLKIYIA